MSQIQEAYSLLTQIDKLLADIELKIQRIETGGGPSQPALKELTASFTKVERIFVRYLALSKTFCGSEDGRVLLNLLARISVQLQMIYMSGSQIAGGVAAMASGNLFFGALGIAGGVAGFGMSQASMLEGY